MTVAGPWHVVEDKPGWWRITDGVETLPEIWKSPTRAEFRALKMNLALENDPNN